MVSSPVSEAEAIVFQDAPEETVIIGRECSITSRSKLSSIWIRARLISFLIVQSKETETASIARRVADMNAFSRKSDRPFNADKAKNVSRTSNSLASSVDLLLASPSPYWPL